MKMITVVCPHCHQKNEINQPPIEGGSFPCEFCQKIFKVTPKKKLTPNATKTINAEKTQPNLSDQPEHLSIAKVKPIQFHDQKKSSAKPKPSISTLLTPNEITELNTTDHNSKTEVINKEVNNPIENTTKQQASATPLSTEKNKAPTTGTITDTTHSINMSNTNKETTSQAPIDVTKPSIKEKSQQNSSTQSLNQQIAAEDNLAIAENEKKPITHINLTDLSEYQQYPAQAETQEAFHATQNNTEIKNLVFTLLPPTEKNQSKIDVPLLLNDNIERTEAISEHQKKLTVQQDKLHREFNWTLASLIALTVLIIQLFYLMTIQ